MSMDTDYTSGSTVRERYDKLRSTVVVPQEPCFVGYYKPTRGAKSGRVEKLKETRRKNKQNEEIKTGQANRD